MPTAKSQTLSLGLHAAAVAILLLATSHSIVSPPPGFKPHQVVHLAPLPRLHLKAAEQRSGGSNQTLLPAKHGAPPPRAHRVFIPPKALPDPKLPMPASVDFEVQQVALNFDDNGDPFSKLRSGAFGDRGDYGIGGHPGRGVGDGEAGPPGISRGADARHKATLPQLIQQVEPEFSEEARKAKYSGVVILTIEVDTNGRTRAFRILQSPGLGLDEKAIEAVAKWRFRPGYRDGKPVVTSATVEVNFRLL
jgi:protein TonB